MLGSQPSLLYPQVSDSLPTHHHTCLGSCHSKTTCDRPLGLFTHNGNHSNKTSNAKGLLYSTLLQSSCVVRGAAEYIELFAPMPDGTRLLHVFNSYICSFLLFVCMYPCQAVISLYFACLFKAALLFIQI